MKTLGIFISTPGRRSLVRTLHSIAYQKAPVEDVLVVGDGYHEQTSQLCDTAKDTFDLPIRYVATEKTRDWGHSQQNYALQHVRGDYVIYQDDDDIFLPRALTEAAELAEAEKEPRPIIGRIKTPNFGLLWQSSSPMDAVLDGHCLLVPNDKKRLGWFTTEYNGDQAYIHTTLRNYRSHAWADRVWTLTRPHWKLWPDWSSQGKVTWVCDLHRDDGGVPGILLATLLLERDGDADQYVMTINSYRECSLDEYQEIAEFAVYAGQSKDVRIKIKIGQTVLREALLSRNYKEHWHTDTEFELYHDWPPDFWTRVEPFNRLITIDGKPIMDWHDPIWGGRAVE